MTAFDLRSKLIDKRFKNSQLEDDKKCERLNFSERLIPTLKQTQAFVRQYRKANGINSPESVEKLVKEHSYRENIPDDEPFFFNYEKDDNYNPVVGLGGADPFRLMVTSKRLMKNLEHDGVHHIDGTYRITSESYPLVVFGISDQCGGFHPIGFMLTSSEKQEDFEHFYDGLQGLAIPLDIEFNPEFIMQDACPASRNAAKKIFPDAIVLMCYFHVKKNIKENLKTKYKFPLDK